MIWINENSIQKYIQGAGERKRIFSNYSRIIWISENPLYVQVMRWIVTPRFNLHLLLRLPFWLADNWPMCWRGRKEIRIQYTFNAPFNVNILTHTHHLEVTTYKARMCFSRIRCSIVCMDECVWVMRAFTIACHIVYWTKCILVWKMCFSLNFSIFLCISKT